MRVEKVSTTKAFGQSMHSLCLPISIVIIQPHHNINVTSLTLKLAEFANHQKINNSMQLEVLSTLMKEWAKNFGSSKEEAAAVGQVGQKIWVMRVLSQPF